MAFANNNQSSDWPAETNFAGFSHGCGDFCLSTHVESPGISLHPGNDAVGQLCDNMYSMPFLVSPDHSPLHQTPSDSHNTYISPRRNYREKHKEPPGKARRPLPSYQEIVGKHKWILTIKVVFLAIICQDLVTAPVLTYIVSTIIRYTGSICYLASHNRSKLQPARSNHPEEVR